MRFAPVLLIALLPTFALAQTEVTAEAQTAPLATGPTSGRDVGLWLSPDGGALVLASNLLSGAGLSTYTLAGALKESGNTGPAVSIDVRYGVTALDATFDLVLLGQQLGGLVPMVLTENGTLQVLSGTLSAPGSSPSAMGLWRPPSGALRVLVSGGNRSLDDYALVESAAGVSLSLVRKLPLGAEPRFVRVDDRRGVALVTTSVGTLLKLELSLAQPTVEVIALPDAGATELGGVAAFSSADGGLLAVISQPTSSSYWVYDFNAAGFLGSFQVRGVGGSGVVSGQGVSAAAAGLPGFSRGLLVFQDAANLTGPNAKLVSLDALGAAVGFEAALEPSPRGPGGSLQVADAGPPPVVPCPADPDGGSADGGATDGGCGVAVVDGGPIGGRDGGGSVVPPVTGTVVCREDSDCKQGLFCDSDRGTCGTTKPPKACGCSEAGLLWPAAVGALLWALRRRR